MNNKSKEDMTPEEAIAEISFLKVAVNKVMEQALEMAIQALEKENIYDDKEHYVTISKALYDKLNIDYEQALSQEPTMRGVRMKVLIDIPKDVYERIREYYEKNDTVESTYGYIYHGTPIPDNATNGDMIKAMFPNEHDFETDFDAAWWNAPYQKGGTNEK